MTGGSFNPKRDYPHGVVLPAPGVPVYLEGLPGNFPARLVHPGGWNGWVCPAFERSTVETIGAQIRAQVEAGHWGREDVEWPEWREDLGGFVMVGGPYEEERTEDGREDFDAGTDYEGVTLYSTGAWGWCWEFVAPCGHHSCGWAACTRDVEAYSVKRAPGDLGSLVLAVGVGGLFSEARARALTGFPVLESWRGSLDNI